MSSADVSVLRAINTLVDGILSYCSTDDEFGIFSAKFMVEQAADKAAFESERDTANKEDHMFRVFQRMIDLALAVARHTLRSTFAYAQTQCQEENSDTFSSLGQRMSPTSPDILRCSSVDDFADAKGRQKVLAYLSHESVELLSLILTAHPKLCSPLQLYMFSKDVVEYACEALTVSREHELTYFEEGHKTELMRLVANLSFSNEKLSEAIASNDALLREVLSGTKIDEENPGLGEWSKFAIRNICESTQLARDRIKAFSAVGVDGDSQKILSATRCSLSSSGQMQRNPPN